MGIILSGESFVLDEASERKIVELAKHALREKHCEEYDGLLKKFRNIIFLQEVTGYKKYLEHRHPEQVNQIFHLRAILNHQRTS
jgi:hypothetical protein